MVMAGIVPGQSTLAGNRSTLGYREVRARRATALSPVGRVLRGHEFHWSIASEPAAEVAAYDVLGGTGRVEGDASDNVLASYVHLHFASDAALAPRLVDACAGGEARGALAPAQRWTSRRGE